MVNERFVNIGIELAKKFFDKRSRGKGRNVEVHVSEANLAALLAMAAERGARAEPQLRVPILLAKLPVPPTPTVLRVGPPDTRPVATPLPSNGRPITTC